jgi:hypothetical protein
MIEAAQRKLREASFFYGHLVSEQNRRGSDPEAFRFYFSAFIEAARSLTWAMKAEETDKYLTWETVWKEQLTAEEIKLEKITNDLRIKEVKRLGADIIVEMEEIAVVEMFAEPGFHAVYRQHTSGPPGVEQIKTKRPKFYFEHEDGKADLTVLCKEYLAYLEKKVGAFLAAHGGT